MQLHLATAEGNWIGEVGEDFAVVAGVRRTQGVIILPERIVEWPAVSAAEVCAARLQSGGGDFPAAGGGVAGGESGAGAAKSRMGGRVCRARRGAGSDDPGRGLPNLQYSGGRWPTGCRRSDPGRVKARTRGRRERVRGGVGGGGVGAAERAGFEPACRVSPTI